MINGSAFIAPSRAGIDTWAKLGNNRWTYDALAPYYSATYSVESPNPNICKDMGIELVSNIDPAATPKGPVQVSFPSLVKPHPVAKAWNEVFKGKGYNTTAKLFPIQSAGNRCYTAAIDPQTQKRSSSDSQSHDTVAQHSIDPTLPSPQGRRCSKLSCQALPQKS